MNKIVTRTATIFRDINGIVHIVMHNNVEVDLEDMIDNSLVIRSFRLNENDLRLIDSRGKWSMNTKAKKYFAARANKQNIGARAILTNNIMNKIWQSLLLKLKGTGVETKLFTDYDEAYNWLLDMKR